MTVIIEQREPPGDGLSEPGNGEQPLSHISAVQGPYRLMEIRAFAG
jgi:hypothetical protein